ncbi:FMN-binding protein [Phycicoccus sp. HDW14]|uniref:FMN-binding protein n=1 Tax=Phycicoccus sp. HDW14 TaxID=2714941 RepID=UPI00140A235E|nr:FMN-binding protein [Phycicoccus sp. HDW14]QIM20480.1 FMN-binding protein [Phycicoccus sp. HDW14]
MRRITTWLLSTLSALVLLFSYHTSTNSGSATAVATGSADAAANGSTDSGSSGSADSGTDSGTDSGSAATPTPTPSADAGSGGSSGSSSSSGTFTGDAVQTRYGPVQVEITVKNGKITKSVVTQVPWNDHKDQEINSYAVPILNDEAVQAQSAGIDMVSGATFTSDAYIQSLQSAIDQANL